MPFRLHPPHRERLANGLTLLVQRTTTAPVVAINTYVKAGYFDETDDIVGIAHVLEHMFFKGTARRGVGAIAKATKAAGGYLNAHTIYDHTSYYTVLPASSVAEGIDIQADAYANSVIDAQELARELEVIIQEANRKLDHQGAVTTETLYELLFDAHRMRRWRIGREDGLRRLTRDDVVRFYHNWYTPSNTILSVVGDVDIDAVCALVERTYGVLPARTPVRAPGPEEPERADFRVRERSGDVAQTHVTCGWRTVPFMHQDTPALDVAASVLGTGRASRLYRAVRDRRLARSASAYNYSPVEVGVFAAHTEGDPATAADAARATWAQVRALREGAVHPDEVDRAQRLFAARWARRLETAEGRAAYLAEWEAMGEWTLGDAYYEAYTSITADDVTRVAQAYLAPDRAGVVVYRPQQHTSFVENAVSFQEWIDAADPMPLTPSERVPADLTPPRAAATFVHEEAGVRVYRTAHDIPILIAPRPEAAITSFGVYATGGAIHEPAHHAGLTALTARAMIKATTRRDAVRIAEDSELLGGSIAAAVGGESFGWSMSVPRDNLLPALELLSDVVQHATLPDDVLDTERRALQSEIAELRDDMYRYPMRLATAAAFEGHPYGIPVGGTEATLPALTGDLVRHWYRETLLRAPFVIAIVGAVDPDATAAAVAARFDMLRVAEDRPVTAPVWPATTRQASEAREKAQTALALAFPAPARTHPDRFVAQTIAAIASGLGGRFFDELRDRQSLAYTVHAFTAEYRDIGVFLSYIATSPEKEAVARAGLLHEFERFCREPVHEDELARAKRYMLGMHDIRQERGGAVLGEMIDAWLFGRGLHELAEYQIRIDAVTAADVQRVAKEYFDPARSVEGVVRGV